VSIRDLDREVLLEMSMVDIVFALLKEGNKQPRPYSELIDEVAKIKGFTEKQKLEAMPRLYTEINIDGRFNGLGDNVWGLRSWYPVEQVEEIVITDLKKKPKKKKVKDDLDDDDFLDDDYLDDEDLDDELVDEDDDIDDIDDLDEIDEDLDEIDEDITEDLDEELPIDEDEEFEEADESEEEEI
jgi:DNA-directed RNA polymerase subunit delta